MLFICFIRVHMPKIKSRKSGHVFKINKYSSMLFLVNWKLGSFVCVNGVYVYCVSCVVFVPSSGPCTGSASLSERKLFQFFVVVVIHSHILLTISSNILYWYTEWLFTIYNILCHTISFNSSVVHIGFSIHPISPLAQHNFVSFWSYRQGNVFTYIE